jgi:hypothetical protein
VFSVHVVDTPDPCPCHDHLEYDRFLEVRTLSRSSLPLTRPSTVRSARVPVLGAEPVVVSLDPPQAHWRSNPPSSWEVSVSILNKTCSEPGCCWYALQAKRSSFSKIFRVSQRGARLQDEIPSTRESRDDVARQSRRGSRYEQSTRTRSPSSARTPGEDGWSGVIGSRLSKQ